MTQGFLLLIPSRGLKQLTAPTLRSYRTNLTLRRVVHTAAISSGRCIPWHTQSSLHRQLEKRSISEVGGWVTSSYLGSTLDRESASLSCEILLAESVYAVATITGTKIGRGDGQAINAKVRNQRIKRPWGQTVVRSMLQRCKPFAFMIEEFQSS